MARVPKSTILKSRIIQVATSGFLEHGYSNTSIKSIADALDISPGSITFHFPSKEHLLAELVALLCQFQWQLIDETVEEGKTTLLAMCLELTAMAAICEEDEIARDFFLSAYTHPMTLDVIQKNDKERAKMILCEEQCVDWSEERLSKVGALVSGIEYATLAETECAPPLETRIGGGIDTILILYGIPEEIRQTKIQKALSTDYRALGRRILKEFKEYIENTNEQILEDLLERRKNGQA